MDLFGLSLLFPPTLLNPHLFVSCLTAVASLGPRVVSRLHSFACLYSLCAYELVLKVSI